MLSRMGSCLKSKGGFTLIELMIVVAIIGILVAVAVPSFVAFRDRSRLAANVVSASSARAALAAAASDDANTLYPATVAKPSDLSQYGATLTDTMFKTFTYTPLPDANTRTSYKIAIVTLDGKDLCITPEQVMKAACP